MRPRLVDIMTVQLTDEEEDKPEPPPKRTATETSEKRLAIKASQLPTQYKTSKSGHALQAFQKVLDFIAKNSALPQQSKHNHRRSETSLRRQFDKASAKMDDLSHKERELLLMIRAQEEDVSSAKEDLFLIQCGNV